MTNLQRISIVIPVYNAENSIGRLVNELVANLEQRYTLEIILVNDRSRDSSERVCAKIYRQYPSIIRFLSLAKNVGEHNAVMAGLNHVTGDFAVIMDDDFQNPVGEVERLIEYAVQAGHDVVYTYYDKKEHSLVRNLGSRFNDKVANLMLNKPGDLYLSSFKIIKHSLIREIVKYDLPYPYVDGLILRCTDDIGRLKVKHAAREDGKSGYTFRKLVSLWLNMFTNFSVLPLRFATLLGFLFASLGFIFGVLAILERITQPELPQGYTFMFVFIAVISGVQLISIGLLGEYIGRLFLSQSKKPQYTIRRAYLGSDENNPNE